MEEKKTETTTRPRVYVASLADYNAGHLLGRWIDADQSADDIHKEIAEMLAESKEPITEEWAIHDYENFGSLRLSEFEDLAYVAAVAELMGEHGTVFAEVAAYASDIDEARRYMDEGYYGEFDRLYDYAAQFIEECYGSEIENPHVQPGPRFLSGLGRRALNPLVIDKPLDNTQGIELKINSFGLGSDDVKRRSPLWV